MKKYPPVTKDLDKKQYTCPYMADGCTQRLTCLMVYMEFCLHIAISHKETRKFLSEDSTTVIVIVLKTLYPGEEPINQHYQHYYQQMRKNKAMCFLKKKKANKEKIKAILKKTGLMRG